MINFSGFLANHESVAVTTETVRGTRIFWGHGYQDGAIPFSLAETGRTRLREVGADLTARDYPDSPLHRAGRAGGCQSMDRPGHRARGGVVSVSDGERPRLADSVLNTAELDNRARYQLLTSLVVPRPIGWVSSRSAEGVANLAPFSYFMALSATPMLVGVSIGSRRGSPKDTLSNIRSTGEFCINVVTERHLHAMNESAGEHPPDVDEFEVAGVAAGAGHLVSAPFVADCPAVLECRLFKEVELADETNILVIGEVLGVSVSPDLEFLPEHTSSIPRPSARSPASGAICIPSSGKY